MADHSHAAACGLFCPACGVFIATKEDPVRLEQMARERGRPAEDVRCNGCNSETVSFYCRGCSMRACAAERGLRFCGECSEYPCAELREFQAQRPHRLELWDSLARIRTAGYDQWYAEQEQHFACPQCGAINSAYHLQCRKCGTAPSCVYVERHGDELRAWMEARK